MRFLCDQMVSRIGKWLRAAGHDTYIVDEPINDSLILQIALSEHRLLITRDRHFLKMKKAAPLLHYLKSNDFSSCMNELNQQLSINWLYAPFTRCLLCNRMLEKVSDDSLDPIPQKIRLEKERFWLCPVCNHYFWEGSHTNKMLEQLKRWQDQSKFNRPLA